MTRQAMSIRPQPRDANEPHDGRALDAVSIGSDMIVGDLQRAPGVHPTMKVDRRLRNWLLLGNVLAWILIVVAVRWLLF